jgi:hypothetical protein
MPADAVVPPIASPEILATGPEGPVARNCIPAVSVLTISSAGEVGSMWRQIDSAQTRICERKN